MRLPSLLATLFALVVTLVSGALPQPAQAQSRIKEEVVLGLSQNSVEITTDFNGSEILIFGAVKREEVVTTDRPLHVLVTLSGPSVPATVRRKAKRFGIWTNVDAVVVDRAPIFYAVATSAPFDEALTQSDDRRYRVSIDRAILSIGAKLRYDNAVDYVEALTRIREDQEKYVVLENTVEVDQETLFSTKIQMPPDLTEGEYTARILLTRGGYVVADHETAIDVRKVGLERFLYTLSQDQPVIYGILALFIAMFSGWLASAIFTLIRNR